MSSTEGNDNVLSWSLSGLGGAIELVTNQVKGRTTIQSDKAKRLRAMADVLAKLADIAEGKSE